MTQQLDQRPEARAISGEGARSDFLARQKRFALMLSGDDRVAQALVERFSQMQSNTPDSSLSASALQFFAFKKLYELWESEGQRAAGTASLFQPGREHEAVQQGLDPSIAKAMGDLPSLHRALLLLIYGENFSYAATAQLFNIPIEQLMNALASARLKFIQPENAVASASQASKSVSNIEVSHDATL